MSKPVTKPDKFKNMIMKQENNEKNKENLEEKLKELIHLPEKNDHLPSFPTRGQIDEYKEFLKNYEEFIDSQLIENIDFGKIPGIAKPTLLKPGAEKLEKLFFLTHEKIMVEKIVENDFIKYTYRTVIYDKNGNVKATCEGTCNSKENKYRWIWEKQEANPPKNEADKLKATGEYKWRKEGNNWAWLKRSEKKDYYDIENTIMKMAQKRSYVGAVLEAANSSGRFTQDIENLAPEAQNGASGASLAKDADKVVYEPLNASTGLVGAQERSSIKTPAQPIKDQEYYYCQRCDRVLNKMTEITKTEASYSKARFKAELCRSCQAAANLKS